MMRTIIEIYFAINIFLVGYYFGDNYNRNLLTVLVRLLFGLPLFVLYYLIEGATYLYKKIDKSGYVVFFFHYLFTKRVNSIPKHELYHQNILAKRKSNLFKFCVKLMNKRNNYIHPEEIEPPF